VNGEWVAGSTAVKRLCVVAQPRTGALARFTSNDNRSHRQASHGSMDDPIDRPTQHHLLSIILVPLRVCLVPTIIPLIDSSFQQSR
jgi:hypothetical protein